MHISTRLGRTEGCHRCDRAVVRVERVQRKAPLPPRATATMEAPPAQRRSVQAPSRAVVIGGSVAGLLSAAAASHFFDEVSEPLRNRP